MDDGWFFLASQQLYHICKAVQILLTPMSATGTRPLPPILLRSVRRANTTIVALSHATKKLVRLIFSIEKSGQPYAQRLECNYLNSQQRSDKTSALLYPF